ncbi:MAG: DUF3616 domain-containing protein [Polaromonas sp.]
MTPDSTPMFQPLTGIFEPSGIRQLADGRFLVVEDEEQHPFSLVTIGPDGAVSSTAMKPGFFEAFDSFWKLDDLEGVALDQAGNLYAITSHSRDADGSEKKPRNKLVRFRIEGDRIVKTKLVKDLKPALLAAHPVLAQAAANLDVKASGGFNIEALEMSTDQQRLLIGFRSPLLGNRALITSVENPTEIFDADAPPRISATLITLDLGGNGIRAMSYISFLDGYLISGGPAARAQVQFQAWFWSGAPDEPARRVSVAGLPGFEHTEGISPAVIDGRQRIIFVSDDGSRAEGRFARFLLLDPGQLQIEA